MTATQKKKLCWQCEGRVSAQDESCPYCGVSLAPLNVGHKGNDSLFAPPYRVDQSKEMSHSIPRSPFEVDEPQVEMHANASEAVEEQEKVEEISTPADKLGAVLHQEVLIPLSLLTLGLIVTLFSLVLLLFSNHGTLTLTWNGDYWFFYLAIGAILFGLGWRTLQNVK